MPSMRYGLWTNRKAREGAKNKGKIAKRNTVIKCAKEGEACEVRWEQTKKQNNEREREREAIGEKKKANDYTATFQKEVKTTRRKKRIIGNKR